MGLHRRKRRRSGLGGSLGRIGDHQTAVPGPFLDAGLAMGTLHVPGKELCWVRYPGYTLRVEGEVRRPEQL